MIVKVKFIKRPERFEVFNFYQFVFFSEAPAIKKTLCHPPPHFNPVNLRLSFVKITRSLFNQVPRTAISDQTMSAEVHENAHSF